MVAWRAYGIRLGRLGPQPQFYQHSISVAKPWLFGGVGQRNCSTTVHASKLRKIEKLLIANRGEIACRIIHTAKRLGIGTVAIYSEPDKNSLHTKLADEAYFIGPAASQESYLRKDKILHVAKKAYCEAVHPGYGFLSENAEFAELCHKESVIFVGPPASAIRDMGLKNTAKTIMENAGVPIIKGYHGSEQSNDVLFVKAEQIGFPVMLKAVRGGGGKGMRIVLEPDEFMHQLESARREAMKSFGNDEMIVEKFVSNPRHVEVQVFGDMHGNYVYLHERDCSVQRRHQKIIEEAPAPKISEETRRKIGEAAVRAAAAVNYVGAGTVEFIMDARDESQFFFMEMNTRLQMITDTDLVEWQLRVAQGERLPKLQAELPRKGHAFEARIYAEDPDNNFMPCAGPLHYLKVPTNDNHPSVRVETGVLEGDEVSVHYDPMIAKLVVWGPDRLTALKRLCRALNDYHIVGLTTNVPFLLRLATHAEFQRGNVHTNFIPDFESELLPKTGSLKTVCPKTIGHLVAGYLLQQHFFTQNSNYNNNGDPFGMVDAFRVNLQPSFSLHFVEHGHHSGEMKESGIGEIKVKLIDGRSKKIHLSLSDNQQQQIELEVGDFSTMYTPAYNCTEFSCTFSGDGLREKAKLVSLVGHGTATEELHLFVGDGGAGAVRHVFTVPKPNWTRLVETGHGTALTGGAMAPMPGVIEKLLVEVGQSVKNGDPLVVLIAMKMEYTVRAAEDGIVTAINCSIGESVAKDAQLVTLSDA